MRLSLEGKLAALLLTVLVLSSLLAVALAQSLGEPLAAFLIVASLGILPVLWLARRAIRPVRLLLRALSGAVASYRDGDFNLSLPVSSRDELGELARAHNELGRALREQRSQLTQRELLLDTVTQHSPVALLLVDPHQRVVYANLAARQLFNEGRSIVGLDFVALLARTPESFRLAAAAASDSLFTADIAGAEETFHLSQRVFQLRGRPHRLCLVKHLTRELSRQEVTIWKKLIRVLSHELNNSLGPIASLAQTGREFDRRGDETSVAAAFTAIGERAQHLHQFIAGYATFARLPAPQPTSVAWEAFLGEMASTQHCTVIRPLPSQPGWFDRPQLEQVLINLLKNAREAGGPPEHIEIAVTQAGAEDRIEVRDRGPGMSEAVLRQAWLPFYSTKRSGTGLGLALAREIAEAHGGHLRLANREGRGLSVTVSLPACPPASGEQRPGRDAST
jgi:two-component system, NtrC family, nitrogen regulation sensor histidine kinase NtrY